MNKNKGIVVMLLLLFLCSLYGVQGEDTFMVTSVPEKAGLPPGLNFTYVIDYDCRTVTFTSTYHWCQNFSWDFTCDGTIDAYGVTAVYTYPSDGMFMVEHTADDLMDSYWMKRAVYIGWPTADFSYTVDGLTVTVVDESSDCDGSIGYSGWSFTCDGYIDAEGLEASFTYPGSGVYRICHIVQDNVGHTSGVAKNITVSVNPVADLYATGEISMSLVKPGTQVTDEIRVMNQGEPESLLDWQVQSYPSWGTWSFSPSEGVDLTPIDGMVYVSVEVIVPDDDNTEFTGTVVLVNVEDPGDIAEIPVMVSTEKTRVFSWEWMIIRFFPRMAWILQ